jgi:hypothetical protein
MMALLKLLTLALLSSLAKKTNRPKLFWALRLTWLQKCLTIERTIIRQIFGQLVWLFTSWYSESKYFIDFRVPFIAGNIIDLLKKIKNEPLTFPRPCHPLIEDVLRKMLVVNP